jgi:hypothetical protein
LRHELAVVDDNGDPVPNLPGGGPSIQPVPIGLHCFDDIAPCTCDSRKFVLRPRSAPAASAGSWFAACKD